MRPREWRGAWMEVLLLLLAAASFLLGWSLTEAPPPAMAITTPSPGVLRLVTWNVGGSGQGGRPLGDELLVQVAATLSELEAHLVALQEVRSQQQLDQLVGRLPGQWTSFLASGDGARVAILARAGDLRARSWPGSGRFAVASYRPPRELMHEGNAAEAPAPVDPDGADINAADPDSADSDAADRQPGRRDRRDSILLAVLHADAFSAQERNQSIGLAVDMLDRFPQRPKLLLGDFNFDLGLNKRQDLFSNDEHLDVESYNYLADRYQDAGLGGGSTAEPDRRLDYIFFSPRHFELVVSGPVKGRRWGDMDHDPLLADLRPR